MNTSKAGDVAGKKYIYKSEFTSRPREGYRKATPRTCYGPSDSKDNSDTSSETTTDEESSMADSLVEDTNYRRCNLPLNNVHLVGRSEPLPASQLSLAESVCGPSRTCPAATAEDCQTANRESEERLGLLLECDVEDGFQNKVTKKIRYTAGVQCSRRVHIDFDHVPHKPDVARGNKLSQPVPDLLYGYKRSLFEQNGATIDPLLAKSISANKAILMLPFLAIEIKAQWPPASGNLCVAENQATGSS